MGPGLAAPVFQRRLAGVFADDRDHAIRGHRFGNQLEYRHDRGVSQCGQRLFELRELLGTAGVKRVRKQPQRNELAVRVTSLVDRAVVVPAGFFQQHKAGLSN